MEDVRRENKLEKAKENYELYGAEPECPSGLHEAEAMPIK
jgi:hypothetical protein